MKQFSKLDKSLPYDSNRAILTDAIEGYMSLNEMLDDMFDEQAEAEAELKSAVKELMSDLQYARAMQVYEGKDTFKALEREAQYTRESVFTDEGDFVWTAPYNDKPFALQHDELDRFWDEYCA